MNTPIFLSRFSSRCRSALALSLFLPVVLLAALQQPPSRSDRPPEAGQKRGIRVEVNLVNVLASVLDKDNRPAPDLPPEAFELYEEGVLQKVEVFEKETQQPLDLALMIDSSLSTLLEMPFEREAAAHFIRQVVRPGDSLAVYAFDEDVHQLSKFSSVETARRAALRAGALLYTIVIRAVKNESGRNTAGEHAIQTITETTGGAMFFPDAPKELDAIFDRIDRELRTQYRLGYYPNPRGPANTFRKIEVRVKGEYTVRHRKGYFTAPAPE